MTQKLSFNGSGLPKAHSKEELIYIVEQALALQPDCSVVDLDVPMNQNGCPSDADLSIWVDTWHNFVDALGQQDNAQTGIQLARDFLADLSCRYPVMIFSADTTKPPLDQFGAPDQSLEMLFRESTHYTSIRPIARYHGRKVYLGEKPRS